MSIHILYNMPFKSEPSRAGRAVYLNVSIMSIPVEHDPFIGNQTVALQTNTLTMASTHLRPSPLSKQTFFYSLPYIKVYTTQSHLSWYPDRRGDSYTRNLACSIMATSNANAEPAGAARTVDYGQLSQDCRSTWHLLWALSTLFCRRPTKSRTDCLKSNYSTSQCTGHRG